MFQGRSLLHFNSRGQLVLLVAQKVRLKIATQEAQSNQLQKSRAQVIGRQGIQCSRIENRHNLVNHYKDKQTCNGDANGESTRVVRVTTTERDSSPEEDQSSSKETQHGNLAQGQAQLGLVRVRGQDSSCNDASNDGQQEETSVINQGPLKERARLLTVSVTELGQDAMVETGEDQEHKDDTDRHQGRLSNVIVDPFLSSEGLCGWRRGGGRGHEGSETISSDADGAEEGAEEVDPPARAREAEDELEEEDAKEGSGDAGEDQVGGDGHDGFRDWIVVREEECFYKAAC